MCDASASNQSCHTCVKYISLLRNSSGLKKKHKDKGKTLSEPLEADGLSNISAVLPSLILRKTQEVQERFPLKTPQIRLGIL